MSLFREHPVITGFLAGALVVTTVLVTFHFFAGTIQEVVGGVAFFGTLAILFLGITTTGEQSYDTHRELWCTSLTPSERWFREFSSGYIVFLFVLGIGCGLGYYLFT